MKSMSKKPENELDNPMSKLLSINTEDRLYVLSCGKGVSSLGFDNFKSVQKIEKVL